LTAGLGAGGGARPAPPRPAPAPTMPPPTTTSRRTRQRVLTTTLVALTRVLERVDEQILPATYYGVSCSLGATPSQLGAITFARLLVQALASPLGGVLGLRYHRARVCGGACLAWAACCVCFALVRSLKAAAIVWAVNGVGLAVLVPNAQGLIADLYPARKRGRAFGLLLGVGHAGSMLATLFAASIGNMRFGPEGKVAGWRLAFLGVAAASAGVGLLTWRLAHDPRDEGWGDPDDDDEGEEEEEAMAEGEGLPRPSNNKQRHHPPPHELQSLASLLDDARRVVRVPSFLVVVAQGVLGSTPWSALAFLTLYHQLRGWPDAAAAGVLAAFSAASAVGSVIGGFAGDAASKPFPDHGRVAVCQLSVLSGVPLAFMLFRAVPREFSSRAVVLTTTILVCKGLLTQWAATAANNPIFAEVVEPRLRTVVYSLDRAFEGALSALGAPLVGKAAEALFGFGGGGEEGGAAAAAARCGEGGGKGGGAFARHEPDRGRADALASAMLLFTTVPWLLCALVYTALHTTYPRDKRRVAAERAAAGGAGRRRQGEGGRGGWSGLPALEEEEDEDEEGRRADRVLGGGEEAAGAVEMGRLLGGGAGMSAPPLPAAEAERPWR